MIERIFIAATWARAHALPTALAIFALVAWFFKPHLLDALSHVLGYLWHLVTRRTLDSKDRVTYIVHRQTKILRVQQFFRVSRVR